MFQDKARTAMNGPVLHKGCNTVLGHLGASHRASWEAVVRSVRLWARTNHCTRDGLYAQPLPNSLNS